MDWATFWATFSRTHLVTLPRNDILICASGSAGCSQSIFFIATLNVKQISWLIRCVCTLSGQ
jgi:hypothetical protein